MAHNVMQTENSMLDQITRNVLKTLLNILNIFSYLSGIAEFIRAAV